MTALNLHASIISSQTKVATEIFYDSFAHFIQLLQGFGYAESLLKAGKSNALVDAYNKFLQYANSEVSEIVKVTQD